MNSSYNTIEQLIAQKQRNVRASMYQPPSIEDIEFMINELISDCELSVDEYVRLNSELTYLKSKTNC